MQTPGAAKKRTALEDYVEGSVHEFGTYDVTEDEIISFATQYDPQTFHIDPKTANEGEYKGVIASGWHTASMMMRLLADNFLPPDACLGSPGVDELRWILPVRPGDKLSIRITVLEARPSRSKPDRGIVVMGIETMTQDKTVVMKQKAITIMLTREGLKRRKAGAA